MGAVAYRARRRLTRRRAGPLAAVALIGLLGGVTLAALIGARRNATAYHRLVGYVRPYDVLVNPDYGALSKLNPAAVARLPQIRAVSGFDGFYLVPTTQSANGATPDPTQDDDTISLAVTNTTAMGQLWRPRLIAGRLPDPSRDDEVLVDRKYADVYHVHVGDTLHLALYGPQVSATPPPPVSLPPLRITGVGVLPDEISQAQGVDEARLVLTAAFDAEHHPSTSFFGVTAWLRRGDADMPAFRSAVQAMVPDEQVEFQTQNQTAHTAEQAVHPETVALVAFGALAAAATLVVAGQVLARRVTDDADDELTLAAIGLNRRKRLFGRLLEAAVVAAAGAAVAVGVALAASALFPIGPAAVAEPHPGFAANVSWLAAGWALVTALLTAATAWPAWRATRADRSSASRPVTRSRVVEALARAGAPPSAVVGVRMALDPGHDRRAVPVRSATFGSIVALGLLVAAIVFGSSLQRLVTVPRSYGWTWDASVEVDAGDPSGLPAIEHYLSAVAARPQVEQAAVLENANVDIRGVDDPALGWRAVKGALAPTILAGRLPTGADEMALGEQTMAATHAHIGDVVDVRGRAGTRPIRVVGQVVLPAEAKYSGADNVALGTGVLLNQKAADAIAPAPDEQHLVVTLRPGSDPHAVLMGGYQDMEQAGNLILTDAPQQPADVVDLGQVRTVPGWLAVLFGVGAAAAIANLVGTAMVRRRRDLGLLKALGFERRQLTRTAAWYATTIAVVTTVVAVPLGLVAGRWAWRWLAHSIGVSPSPAVPVWPLLLALPVAVLVANAAAAGPARRAARATTATSLRSE